MSLAGLVAPSLVKEKPRLRGLTIEGMHPSLLPTTVGKGEAGTVTGGGGEFRLNRYLMMFAAYVRSG